MAGFDNEVMFAPGERLETSNAQSIQLMQDGIASNVSRINFVGDPNGLVAANPSSICHDPVSGFFYLKVSGTGNTVWSRILPSTSTTNTLTPDFDFDGTAATPVAPQAGNINVLSYNPSVANVTNTYNSTGAATGNFQVENKAWLTALVVDPSTTIGSRGTFSTIQSAITAASSGQTIFIRSGTYTENLTLKAGVNLTSFESSSSLNGTGQVIISGTCTMTTAGSVTISGIQLQTNAAAFLAVTGSAASIVNLNNCRLQCTNSTGITFSSSSASARININYCTGDVTTTGIALFAISSAGQCFLFYSSIYNSGLTVTANTISSGALNVTHSIMNIASTSTGTGSLGFFYSDVDINTLNTTCVTAGGSGAHVFDSSKFLSGTASSVSLSSSVSMNDCSVGSSNTNAVTGAGTLAYTSMKFLGTSLTINVTTQGGGTLIGGRFQAPSAGYLGETISNSVITSAPISLVTGAAKTVTSISLTPGVWDITAVGNIQGATTGTLFALSVSTVNNSFGTAIDGNQTVSTPTMPTATSYQSLVVPAVRTVITATTTHYMIAFCFFTVGAPTAFGRISAVRVG